MEKFFSEINNTQNFKYVFSSPIKDTPSKKVIYRKIEDGKIFWQEEKYIKNQVFHSNIKEDEIKDKLIEQFKIHKQCCILNENETINVFNYEDKVILKRVPTKNKPDFQHNKQKTYIINEGDDIPVLRDLKIFTNENKIVASKYDKFKQINKFIEIIDDKIKNYKSKEINIIDFGCGKSYLSFILYHYLTKIKNITPHIKGYDLKESVIENCNAIAKKYDYDNLEFFCEDIANVKFDKKIDMIITLHACDTATDYALNFAIKNNIKYIFSVPCCQHEINFSINNGGDFDILFKHGLFKERFSALLTDSIRSNILQLQGYRVDVLEFIDFEHTPKNIMIRAEKTKQTEPDFKELLALQNKYKFKQKLLDLQLFNFKK